MSPPLPLGIVASGKTGWSPNSLTNLAAWYDASAITGLSDGDYVASWSDLSTASRTLAQSTSGKKPVYKTAIRNSKAVVRFDTDDYMQGTTVSGSAITVAAVLKVSGSGTRGLFFNGSGSGSYHGMGWLIYGGKRTLYPHGSLVDDGSYTNDVWERWIMTSDGSGSRLFVNGTRVIDSGSLTYENPSTNGALTVAGSDGAPEFTSQGMDWAELAIWTEVKSGNGTTVSGDLALIDSYLSTKWGF